jgi:hypothetical protein
MTITIHGVLAGAYKSAAKSLLTHASVDGGVNAICKRVKEYSLCDLVEEGSPTCPVCVARLAKLQAA